MRHAARLTALLQREMGVVPCALFLAAGAALGWFLTFHFWFAALSAFAMMGLGASACAVPSASQRASACHTCMPRPVAIALFVLCGVILIISHFWPPLQVSLVVLGLCAALGLMLLGHAILIATLARLLKSFSGTHRGE